MATTLTAAESTNEAHGLLLNCITEVPIDVVEGETVGNKILNEATGKLLKISVEERGSAYEVFEAAAALTTTVERRMLLVTNVVGT